MKEKVSANTRSIPMREMTAPVMMKKEVHRKYEQTVYEPDTSTTKMAIPITRKEKDMAITVYTAVTETIIPLSQSRMF